MSSLRTEANILKDLNHANVVQLVEVIVDNKMNDFILIEELILGHIVMEESTFVLLSLFDLERLNLLFLR